MKDRDLIKYIKDNNLEECDINVVNMKQMEWKHMMIQRILI